MLNDDLQLLSLSRIKSTLFAALVLIVSSAISASAVAQSLPRSSPASVGMSSERLERLLAAMQLYIDANQLAGTVTLIARDGKVVHFESRGWRDKESDTPMSEDTIFFIMSMTKPIVSTALMMLYEEGLFLLTDPVSKWIPEIVDKQVLVQDDAGIHRMTPRQPITVRDVLAHTTGLDPARELLTEDEQKLLGRESSLEATLIKRAPLPLAFHPSEDWQYGSSTDYVALLVERISGEPLQEFLQKRIFEPLEMNDTSYVVPAEKRDRVATVYSPTGPNKTIEVF